MTRLMLTPVVLSFVLLAAHLLRGGSVTLALLSLLLPGLLLVRRRWSRRMLQLLLVAAGAEWLRTGVALATRRMELGEPWLRMAVILGLVALVTAGSALLLQSERMQQRYGGAAPAT